MEQGCCYFGNKNGRKVLIRHLWNHVLRNSRGARLLLLWQQKRPPIFYSPSLESCAAQLLWSKVAVTLAANMAANFRSTIFGIMCGAALMEQGCRYFGNRNGRKVLTHHLWNHVLRNSYGARLLLLWQQKRPQCFNSPSLESCAAHSYGARLLLLCQQKWPQSLNSPSLESCAAQLSWSKVVVTLAAKTAAKF